MRHFSFRLSPAPSPKLIISVSKKISKKAVVRNRIKRRVRAAFHNIFSKPKPGIYLIIAKSGSEEVKGKELENELKSAMII